MEKLKKLIDIYCAIVLNIVAQIKEAEGGPELCNIFKKSTRTMNRVEQLTVWQHMQQNRRNVEAGFPGGMAYHLEKM